MEPGACDDGETTWYSGCPELPALGHRFTMRPPRATPCNEQCPWLAANHDRRVELRYDHEVPGVPMPDGTFSFDSWKRVEVWEGDLREGVPGYGSLCHVRLAGTRQPSDGPWDVVGHQCTSALVMQQREAIRFVERGDAALSRRGAARVAAQMLGRAVTADDVSSLDAGELAASAHPALLNPTIGCAAVAPALHDDEVERWRSRGDHA